MQIFELSNNNIPAVAKLMTGIKPDWWDFKGAVGQLSDIGNTAALIGWMIGETEQNPQGWLLCTDSGLYSCLNIECLGYDDNGDFVTEHQLEPLIDTAERYARQKGRRILRYMISSTDMSCHGQPLGSYWEALRDLKSHNRAHYDYFAGYGFKPAGFMPNAYGKGFHAIMMIKDLATVHNPC